MAFQKATKKQAKLRLALIGPSGSGKTFTALTLAQHLGQRVALVDTERGSASKYADLFSFDVMELDAFHPQRYIDAIREAEAAGYDVLVIDSLSHAWMGKGGALELVDQAAKRSQSGNSFAAWRDVTPLHNALIDAMLQSTLHLIVTMRAKTEYVMEANERGKQMPRKVGMAPVQRDGLEYEFDVVGDMTLDNDLIVSKTRCPALTGATVSKPGKSLADVLSTWLTEGAPAPVADPEWKKLADAPNPGTAKANGHTTPVAQTQAPTNGNGHAPKWPVRPWDAETTRLAIAAKVDDKNLPVDGDKSMMHGKMAMLNLYPSDDFARHAIGLWLFGKAHSADWTPREAEAVSQWAKCRKNDAGEWIPDAAAISEARAMVEAQAIAEGQVPLFPAQPA